MNPFRRTSTSRLIAAVALATALVPAAADAATKKPVQPQCPDRPGRTLAVDHGLRVYATKVVGTRNLHGKPDPDSSIVRLFSCQGFERKARTLARYDNDLDGAVAIEQAAIGGSRWVVASLVGSSGTGDYRSAVELDASSGKFVVGVSTGDDAGPTVGDGSWFEDLAVAADGGFVYNAPTGLTAVDQDGLRVLVPGDGTNALAAIGVAVGGNRAYWTVDKTQQVGSALLNGHAKGDLAG